MTDMKRIIQTGDGTRVSVKATPQGGLMVAVYDSQDYVQATLDGSETNRLVVNLMKAREELEKQKKA